MSIPPCARRWFGLPGRLALLFGIGAISAAAQPEPALAGPDAEPALVPQQSAANFAELRLWSDDGRIYVSEPGQHARELPLADTPEARHLRQLLERAGAAAGSPQSVRHRIILVGGGGCGFSYTPPANRSVAETPVAPGSAGGAPAQSSPARNSSPGGAGLPGKPSGTADGRKG